MFSRSSLELLSAAFQLFIIYSRVRNECARMYILAASIFFIQHASFCLYILTSGALYERIFQLLEKYL